MSDGWITDKDAIFTLFNLRGVQPGDEIKAHFGRDDNDWNGVVVRMCSETNPLFGTKKVDILEIPLKKKGLVLDEMLEGHYSWNPKVGEIAAWRPYVPKKETNQT